MINDCDVLPLYVHLTESPGQWAKAMCWIKVTKPNTHKLGTCVLSESPSHLRRAEQEAKADLGQERIQMSRCSFLEWAPHQENQRAESA